MYCPSASEIAKKWARVTPERTEDYEEGVRNPKVDWAKATVDAEPSYEKGVQAAITRKAFSTGVKKAGTAKQIQRSIETGIPRFGEGVRMGEPAMAAGMEGVVNIIKGVTLPQRYPRGDPRNYERVRAIGEALHKARIGR